MGPAMKGRAAVAACSAAGRMWSPRGVRESHNLVATPRPWSDQPDQPCQLLLTHPLGYTRASECIRRLAHHLQALRSERAGFQGFIRLEFIPHLDDLSAYGVLPVPGELVLTFVLCQSVPPDRFRRFLRTNLLLRSERFEERRSLWVSGIDAGNSSP